MQWERDSLCIFGQTCTIKDIDLSVILEECDRSIDIREFLIIFTNNWSYFYFIILTRNTVNVSSLQSAGINSSISLSPNFENL